MVIITKKVRPRTCNCSHNHKCRNKDLTHCNSCGLGLTTDPHDIRSVNYNIRMKEQDIICDLCFDKLYTIENPEHNKIRKSNQ